ncbi:DUF3157 family protein [Flavobacterium lacisediminis]|uniref:DUF3157 family protein n=1 Tax=Flavobacterium lacisediminis TaxID=2989705 RepID=A0ABT3EKM5_9FLAO|nr:DUF3157 family protein [Flavobacterium lacisediminis]MCW1149127.1 DUF3157 family protein [Flavobacterium lacisediminis]
MKRIFILGVLLVSTYTFAQNKTATTEDGKKVILKSDKTWEYDESKKEAKNTCVIETGFKEPKYNTSSSWKKMGSTVDDLKKHISVDMEVKQDKIILLEVSEQLGNGVYIVCVDGQKMKWRRTGSIFRKDGEDVLNMKNE